MQSSHEVHGLQVCGIMFCRSVDLVPRYEGEGSDVVAELSQWKLKPLEPDSAEEGRVSLRLWFQIVKCESSEVGQQNVARNLLLTTTGDQVVNIAECLALGSFQ